MGELVAADVVAFGKLSIGRIKNKVNAVDNSS